jgi:hypothetical protein
MVNASVFNGGRLGAFMRTALLVVAALLVSGCLAQPPPVHVPDPLPMARVLCLGGDGTTDCNLEATVSPPTRQANELSIAVNPLDPDNVIATGKDYTPEEAGDCVWAGIYTTKDGGRTWKNQNVPGSPWKRMRDPTVPVTEFSKFWCVTDPVVRFGPDGTAYWTVMPYQCDALSGSKTGRGVLPQGGFNDWFWTCSSMYVLVSDDGGLTWPRWKEVAFGPRLEHDKQWINVAPNGRVLLCWDRSDQITSTGTAADQLDGSSTMLCSVSGDKGHTWTPPKALNPDWPGVFPAVDFDASNVAYAAYVDFTASSGGILAGRVLVSRSLDGVTWSRPSVVGTYQLPPPGGEYNWPVLRGSAFRALNIPLIGVDRTDGPYGGSVYVTWFDHDRGEGDVYVAWSRDGGANWSEPVRVHDDDAAAMADQFYPAISVGPDGTIDVSWWDRREDPNNRRFDVFHTYSKDGGQTWAPNLKVTDVASDEHHSRHQNGMIFLGDYRDSASSARGAHLVWVDTRHEKADVFVATVLR